MTSDENNSLFKDNASLKNFGSDEYKNKLIIEGVLHPHFHSDLCEHLQIMHDDHIDYLHNSQLCHHNPDGKIYIELLSYKNRDNLFT